MKRSFSVRNEHGNANARYCMILASIDGEMVPITCKNAPVIYCVTNRDPVTGDYWVDDIPNGEFKGAWVPSERVIFV